MKNLVPRLLICLLPFVALAELPVSKSFFTGVAIGGIDTVAYHAPNRTQEVQGQKDWTVEWMDAQWRFADEASMNKFAADPERYVPEFNGHCANALSLGEGLVKTDGTVWQFFGDRLFLFYAEKGLQRWQQGDQEAYLEQAEQAWRDITAER